MKGKLIRSMAVTGLLIVAMVAVVTNAAAYEIGPRGSTPCHGYGSGTKVVQLCAYTTSDALQLYLFPGYAADVVMQVARQNGMTIQRTKSSVETEIRGHAYIRTQPNVPIYRSGKWRWSWEVADPMDIEMNYEEPWVYLLD